MDQTDSDAEAGSFAAWFWLANAAIELRPTEEQAMAGKQATRHFPRVLNDIKIREQNPVGRSRPELKLSHKKRKIEELHTGLYRDVLLIKFQTRTKPPVHHLASRGVCTGMKQVCTSRYILVFIQVVGIPRYETGMYQ
jgi:hypothetical protein